MLIYESRIEKGGSWEIKLWEAGEQATDPPVPPLDDITSAD